MIGTAFFTFIACFIFVPIAFAFARLFCLYAICEERTCLIYTLFGKVIGTIDEPGLHLLPLVFGPRALLVTFFGKCYRVDMRLDQDYLRSQPVNSEEGAPMGIGVWFEMLISDPESFLFKNTDPRGSLRANVSNATVRCLSNMKLSDMLENRHQMSRSVRAEVSAQSREWGYQLGSVYIRKVHLRDLGMIRQIEEKVVNRLRQVTGAIMQDGANQVSLITSTAERKAAIELARAQAIRPQLVGKALQEISSDPEVSEAVFEILETQRLLENKGSLVMFRCGTEQKLLGALLAGEQSLVGRG